jgi:hypothetical protein
MLYPSELRAHSGHYRRFFAVVYAAFGGLGCGFHLQSRVFAERHLLFLPPFLMFLSPLDLFTQATQQGDGWTLVKTIAKTRRPYPTTL